MNIQTAFIYCFLTFIVIYIVLWFDLKYILKNNQSSCKVHYDEKIFRTSVLCSFIMWIIIVYFIYQAEQIIPTLTTDCQEILNGNL